MFLFVIHPYDIGDTLLLDGEQCRVDAINITYTTLTSATNAQVWYPNEVLRVNRFVNLSESGLKGDALKLAVDLDTRPEVLDRLREAGAAVVAAFPAEFSGDPSVTLAPCDLPFKMTLVVWWSYSHNGIDLGRTARARTEMYKALVTALVGLGVRYSIPIPPVPPRTSDDPHGPRKDDDDAAALAATQVMMAAHHTAAIAAHAGLHQRA